MPADTNTNTVPPPFPNTTAKSVVKGFQEIDVQDLVDTYKKVDNFNDFQKLAGRFTRFSAHESSVAEVENYFALMYAMEQDILESQKTQSK